MARDFHIRGMLLEEALLSLLAVSGYRVVVDRSDVDDDPTLDWGPTGMKVSGRGGIHQIDAIADFQIPQPFSHPQRLLVEAKCYSNRPAGIEVARNALGVLLDVSEYWVQVAYPPIPVIVENLQCKRRYHYQYALFSATGFTRDAQRYAFVHDIYLIPLEHSRYIKPIIDAIYRVDSDLVSQGFEGVENPLSELRNAVRSRILRVDNDPDHRLEQLLADSPLYKVIDSFCQECGRLRGAVMAVIDGQFPVFLVPNPDRNLEELLRHEQVRIYWDNSGWYLQSTTDEDLLFSFDLPSELLELYAKQGSLSPQRALQLEGDRMHRLQVITVIDGRPEIHVFQLGHDWLEKARQRFR